MPVPNEFLRDFVRFTGDGMPGEPVSAPLPVGDPKSGVWNPSKKDFRDWANSLNEAVVEESPVSMANAYAVSPRASAGFYSVSYQSGRSDGILYGYAAVVSRLTGGQRAVGAQLGAYDLGTDVGQVFGAAFEAWSGNQTTEPTAGTVLVGIEPSIISQRHDSSDRKRGIDLVFKNRRDGGSILHGSIGGNMFNRGSVGLAITSQARSALGEYCGWNKGIWFSNQSLDADIDGLAVAIDLREAPKLRMLYGIAFAEAMSFGLSAGASSGVDISMRYLD